MNTLYNWKGKVLLRLQNMKVCHQSAVYEFSVCVFFARRKSIWQYSHLIWWIWLKAFKGFNKVNTYFKLKILRFTISIFPSPILYCQEVCITKIRVPCLKPCCFNCFPFFYICNFRLTFWISLISLHYNYISLHYNYISNNVRFDLCKTRVTLILCPISCCT